MKTVSQGPTANRYPRYLALTAMVALGLLGSYWTTLVWARPADPRHEDERIAIMVSSRLDLHHLSEMRIDNEISRRAFEMFFKTLDPMKMYFLQSDVDEFRSEETSLDDYVKSGDVGFAKRVYDRFLQRVQQRIQAAQTYVDQKHDFSIDESMIREPDEMQYAKTDAEANERWRKRVKYDLLLQVADDVEEAEVIETLHKRYRGIRRNWEQVNNDELLEMFLSAVTTSFDPHSTYMAPSTLENFEIQMRLELNGIGASLESKYGETIVRRIIPGGAADKDGRLKINDVITGVAQGNQGEVVDIFDMKINDVVQLIRGTPGSVVKLQVMPEDKSGRQEYDIVRARIELKDSEARSVILERLPDGTDPKQETKSDAGDQAATDASQPEEATGQIIQQRLAPNGKVYKIGVIDLPSFYMDMEGRRANKPNYKSTTRDVRRLLEQFNSQGVDLVIMDLRLNGGGSLPESVETTGLFIDHGPVVQVKSPDGRIQPYTDDERGMVWSGPLIVVINKFSASASEIFAGAIQDYGRGIIVGDHATHGKGTVQQLFDLGQTLLPIHEPPNYGALKLTIQQFYRPSGDSTQNRGVVSDIEIPSITTVWEVGESDLDYAMKFDRVMPQRHLNYRSATANTIAELRTRSQQRVESSDYFAKVKKKIAKYLEKKEDPTVTLNKEKFLAERNELNEEKDQDELIEQMQNDDRPVFPSTPYNEELISIAIDYLELLGQDHVAVAR